MAILLNNEIYFNVEEAAAKSGRAKNTVYQKYKSWGWQPYQFGSNILFRKSDIHKWLVNQIKPRNAE